MAVLIDVVCGKCNTVTSDVWSTALDSKCGCGGVLERLWTLTPAPSPNAHPSERAVVYVSQREGGKVQYPGRADVPVPPRLAARGYERVELNPSQLASFERRHNVANERRHFDRNGKGF